LDHIRTNKAFTLSGGERRRVEIARALVTRPHFLMLMNRSAGLDPLRSATSKASSASSKTRIGVLITDHNVQQTLSITDRAYIITDGEILKKGLPRTS